MGVDRNNVLAAFGQPDETVGSINNPWAEEENGLRYNEKWTYYKISSDGRRVPKRVVYWDRYDLVRTVAIDEDGHQVEEEVGKAVAEQGADPFHGR